MSRFLFVVPPLTGHVNPTIALGDELVRRGHDVAWCGLPGGVDPLLHDDATFFPAASVEATLRLAAMTERPSKLRGAAALKFLWERALLPMAGAMADGVQQSVASYRPDVIVTDQQAFAGATTAVREGIPWAVSATTSGELVDPLAALPAVDAMVKRLLVDFQVSHGIDPTTAATTDLRFSPLLTLAYTTEELVGPGPYPGPVSFVGPSLASDPARDGFPWEWLHEDRQLLLVSLGTLNADAGGRFWETASQACRDAEFQAVFVASDALVPNPPDNVLVCEHVPQLALLPRVDAVVSHGGHNTVCESLAAGVPLVVAPIRDDQPIVADQVVRAGAGIRVKFSRVRAPELRTAIDQALGDPQLRAAAARVARSFHAAGGAAAAATLLEDLL